VLAVLPLQDRDIVAAVLLTVAAAVAAVLVPLVLMELAQNETVSVVMEEMALHLVFQVHPLLTQVAAVAAVIIEVQEVVALVVAAAVGLAILVALLAVHQELQIKAAAAVGLALRLEVILEQAVQAVQA